MTYLLAHFLAWVYTRTHKIPIIYRMQKSLWAQWTLWLKSTFTVTVYVVYFHKVNSILYNSLQCISQTSKNAHRIMQVSNIHKRRTKRLSLIPALTASFAIWTTSGECDAIFSPSLIASLTTWSAGKTLLTRPGENVTQATYKTLHFVLLSVPLYYMQHRYCDEFEMVCVCIRGSVSGWWVCTMKTMT